MFIVPPSAQVPLLGSKMLVVPAVRPPLTRMRPSGRLAVPGQNMSWLVSFTSRSVEVPVAGSKVIVYVRPVSLPKAKRSSADHSKIFPSGRFAADTGTIGRFITGDQ